MTGTQQRVRAPREWIYVETVIAAFVFSPFLRRLVEWRGNFDPLNLLAIIPLLMLLPITVFAYRRRKHLRNMTFACIATIWLVGFVYSTFIAAASGNILPALFSGARFCLPLLVGIWFLTLKETMDKAYARLARWLFFLGTIAGGYGVIQYIIAPPWDAAWIQNIDVPGDFGQPAPFEIRLFGVLNDPVVFAMFLSVVIVLNLPFMRARSWLHMIGLPLMSLSIMLSLYRTSWISLGLGIIIFVFLGPKPLQNFLRLSVAVSVSLGIAFAGLLMFPDASVTEKISDRFNTLANVEDDYSFRERKSLRDATIQSALEQPLGIGLGVTGESAKLAGDRVLTFSNGTGGSIDNGFLSRLVEMGVPGFLTFVATVLISICAVILRYREVALKKDQKGMKISASCIAVQIIIFISIYSEDDLNGLLGVLFFATLAVTLLPSATPAAIVSRPRRPVYETAFARLRT